MGWGHLFFNFSGRVNRTKFWIAGLILVVIYAVMTIIDNVMDRNVVFQALNGMLVIVILIVGIAVGVKRLHDRNKSGWYLLLFYFVPFTLATLSVLIDAFVEDSI